MRSSKKLARTNPVLALSLFLPAFLSGCASLPGVHFNAPDQERENVWFGEYQETGEARHLPVDVVPITPEVVAEQRRFNALHSRNDLGSLLNLKSAKRYEYRIGVGDVLDITVWGHPELSSRDLQNRGREAGGSVVNAGGHFFYPYAGMVRAKGLTVDSVRKHVTRKLAQFVQNPQVDVRVSQFHSQKVYVAGNVRQPGWLPVTNVPMRLSDALANAGGVPDETSSNRVQLTHAGKQYQLNLAELELAGSRLAHVYLRAGDSVYVPDNSQEKVYVFGETVRQAVVPIRESRLSLAEALGRVEGLRLDTAAGQGVYVIRGLETEKWDAAASSVSQSRVYQLDVRSAEMLVLADQFLLRSGDVVFVAAADLVRFNRALSKLLPSLQAAFQSKVIAD